MTDSLTRHVSVHRFCIVLSFAQTLTLTTWLALSICLSYMGLGRALRAAIRLVVASLLRDAFNSLAVKLCFSQKFQVTCRVALGWSRLYLYLISWLQAIVCFSKRGYEHDLTGDLTRGRATH